MSGNSERRLKGADLCPQCLGRKPHQLTPTADSCYFVLETADGKEVGFLNCDNALVENGGTYEELVEFDRIFENLGVIKIFNSVQYLTCNVCRVKFLVKHELFEHFRMAYERGRYTFIDV